VLRSLGVIVFIGIVGATAAYFANRPTVAKGHVLAADLSETNATVKAMTCDKDVPIGMNGGRFKCFTEFKNGDTIQYTFAIDRAGSITVVEQGEASSAPVIKKTSDPWGD
jgi:hypothetical protein